MIFYIQILFILFSISIIIISLFKLILLILIDNGIVDLKFPANCATKVRKDSTKTIVKIAKNKLKSEIKNSARNGKKMITETIDLSSDDTEKLREDLEKDGYTTRMLHAHNKRYIIVSWE